jgi:anaphase-promoting complex subunit 1
MWSATRCKHSGHRITPRWRSLLQAHCYAIAGACMAMGMRFAGTGDQEAGSTLTTYLKYFVLSKQTAPEPGSASPGLFNREVLETCAGNVALALSLVMAGTGDLPTLKLLRGTTCMHTACVSPCPGARDWLRGIRGHRVGLRKRCAPPAPLNGGPGPFAPPTSSLTYGAHMAISMALGFVFLGAGSRTFSRTSASLAYLVIALYPCFPQTSSDNRHHLQVRAQAAAPSSLSTSPRAPVDDWLFAPAGSAASICAGNRAPQSCGRLVGDRASRGGLAAL